MYGISGKYHNVADYNVYVNGTLDGDRSSYEENAKWADTYMKSFYEYYETNSDVDMVNVIYRATGLTPDTDTFKVVAVDKDGKELGTAKGNQSETGS